MLDASPDSPPRCGHIPVPQPSGHQAAGPASFFQICLLTAPDTTGNPQIIKQVQSTQILHLGPGAPCPWPQSKGHQGLESARSALFLFKVIPVASIK